PPPASVPPCPPAALPLVCAPWSSPSPPAPGSTGVGAMAFGAGGYCAPGIAGRGNADRAPAGWQRSRAPTPPPRGWLHAGAREPRRAAPPAVGTAPRARLPAYALDAQPLDALWQQPTQRASLHQDCQAVAALTSAVEQARASVATPAATGRGRLGGSGEA